MYERTEIAESVLNRAIEAVEAGGDSLIEALDALTVPIYVTDAEGVITHFNSACIDYAGRTPIPGTDRWCITWKLYEIDGTHLPHERCPMARAIAEKRPVRGAVAVAERPDGSRVTFVPYPTPIFRDDGSLRCAVNILIDVTDLRQADALRVQARKCRHHARWIGDEQAARALGQLADEYEAKAAELDRNA